MPDFLDLETRTYRCPPAAPSNAEPRFPLGRTMATLSALALLKRHGVSASILLARHQSGDWGEIGADDVRANERNLALKTGARLLSAYLLLGSMALERMHSTEKRRSPRVYVLTERDFRVTTILTPRDY